MLLAESLTCLEGMVSMCFLVKQETVRNVSETICSGSPIRQRWQSQKLFVVSSSLTLSTKSQLSCSVKVSTWDFDSHSYRSNRYMTAKCVCRITAIIGGFQPSDQGSTPCTRAKFYTLFVYWLGYLVFTQEKRDRNSHRVPIMTLQHSGLCTSLSRRKTWVRVPSKSPNIVSIFLSRNDVTCTICRWHIRTIVD